jgi:predicted nuclease of restriction endonuclease-like (RecB) superfamily
MDKVNELDGASEQLHSELRGLIFQARTRTVVTVNTELARLYWLIGARLHDHVLQGERAAYGGRVINDLGVRLFAEFGRGFEAKNLRRMAQFVESYPNFEIVASLMRQLTWTHFLLLLPFKSSEKRNFYATMASNEGWSVRELRRRIEAKTYERTTLAGTQTKGMEHALTEYHRTGALPVSLAFKDPYFLDFLGLHDSYNENALEDAILRELESFILELGTGFAFIERQKRLVLDGEDFYIDLLFYHRGLRRLVAIELKLGRFKASHKGQMELYLRWLDKYARQPGEESPIGLILCAESSREQVELLEMHNEGIVVAEYWTELPPKEELERRLHRALMESRERLAGRRELSRDGKN